MRRFVLVVAAAMLAVGMPATAVAGDLADMLEEGGDAELTGLGVVMSVWGADSAAATYEVVRSDGMTMVHGPAGDLMLSGALSASWSADGWRPLELGGWSGWEMSDRYLAEARAVERLGRPATEMTVFEGPVVRARIVVDDASMVPLFTEVFDDAGELYRMAALLEFTATAPNMSMPDDMPPEHEMLMPSEPSQWLPAAAAGYRLVDSYEMKATRQAYYGDGLFSFSVFESARGPMPGAFERATPFEVGRHTYRRIVTPTVIWVHWDAPDRSYVLVGDLPPDHLAAVLAELPEPGNRNIFVRLWRRLFG